MIHGLWIYDTFIQIDIIIPYIYMIHYHIWINIWDYNIMDKYIYMDKYDIEIHDVIKYMT